MPRAAVAVIALMLLGAGAWGQGPGQRQDPLTPVEANQVRDTAGNPDKRVLLLLSFAQDRLASFENLRTQSPRPPERDQRLYKTLQQYNRIMSELDDAEDDLMHPPANSASQGKVNAKGALDKLIAGETAMDATLHHIQTASTPSDLANYHFMLDDCLEVTADSLQNAKQDAGAPGGENGGG